MNFDAIQPLLDWMQAHPALSGLVVFAIACTESLIVVGVIVPGVVLMLGIGALVGLGALELWSTLLWTVLGAIVGDGVSYWVGRHYDQQLRSIWPFTKHPELLPRGERFFHKHGAISIIIGRFVGPIRPVIPAIAGVMHMNPWVFYAVNIASAIAWAPVVILPGVAVGASMHLASELAGRLMIVFLLLLLLAWGVFLLARLVDKTVLSPYFRHSRRFGKIDYKHMPGLFLNYLLESTLGVFVLTLMLGALLATYSQEKVTVAFPPMQKQQWLDHDWKQFVRARDVNNQRDPFTLQWWTSRERLEQELKANGWQSAVELDYRNALLWLSPSLNILELPMPERRFGTEKQQLMFVYGESDSQTLSLLRIWPAYPMHEPERETLWLATLSQIDVEEFYGFRWPTVMKDPPSLGQVQSLLFPGSKRILQTTSFTGTNLELLLIF